MKRNDTKCTVPSLATAAEGLASGQRPKATCPHNVFLSLVMRVTGQSLINRPFVRINSIFWSNGLARILLEKRNSQDLFWRKGISSILFFLRKGLSRVLFFFGEEDGGGNLFWGYLCPFSGGIFEETYQ